MNGKKHRCVDGMRGREEGGNDAGKEYAGKSDIRRIGSPPQVSCLLAGRTWRTLQTSVPADLA